MIDHVEADDVIAYAKSGIFNDEDSKITVMSTDKDFLQLVDKRTRVYRPTEKKMYDIETVLDTYGVPPHQFMMYRIIEGDSSDNINGIKYVGEKRVKKHLSELLHKEERTNVNDIIEYCHQRIDESTTYERIVDGEDILRRNWKLMQLHDVNVSLTILREIRATLEEVPMKMDRGRIKKLYRQDGLHAGITYLDSWLNESFSFLNQFAKEKD